VLVLGWVSLLNDAASEMISPLLPLFLTATLGAGPAIVGLVEGVAEATASVLKLLAGRLSDRGVGAKGLVLGGYGLANAARPAIGLALGWPFVLLLRFLDRIGKGLRTAPREALIAGAVQAPHRGRAFGFHSAMDNFGAAVGPLLAFALLALNVPLARVFLWSVVPGIAVMLLLAAGIRRDAPLERKPAAPPLALGALDGRLKALIAAVGVLALAAVPEAFVVLWARDAGLSLAIVPLAWAAANLVKTVVAYPAGTLSDRWGRLPLLVGGWLARVVALAALGLVPAHGVLIWLLFMAYSGTLAFTEPVERSLVGDIAPRELRGSVYGLYYLAAGVCVLPGAVLFGLVWEHAGAKAAFLAAALVSALGAGAFALAARRPRPAA